MIEGYIWKTDSITYNFQILSSSLSELKQIENLLKDWNQIGYGFTKNGETINIFSKQIEDPKSLSDFTKALPFCLFEYDRNGNQKQVRTSAIKHKKMKQNVTTKQVGRVCGKCGNRGHNIRTCKVLK